MSKVISQAQAQAAALEKVNGSALNIAQAAIRQFKAAGKLSVQIRSLMASPLPVVQATLEQAFALLADKVKADDWGTVANSIATNVRIIVKGMAADVRPQVCYIALDRGACKAQVIILAKPNKTELKAALGHDKQALNKHMAALFPAKQAASAPKKDDSSAPRISGKADSQAPTGGVIAAIMAQLGPLSEGELQELAKRISAEIEARAAKRLEAEEKKGRGVSAAGKPNAKSSGESQQVAKHQPSKPSRASAAPTAPTTDTGIAASATPGAVLKKGRNESAPTFKQAASA